MDRISTLIDRLYPGKAGDVLPRLTSTIEDFRRRNPEAARPREPLFAEKDAVLICYADHVKEEGVPTLRTLSRFLDEFAGGLFSTVHILPFYPWSSDDGFSVMDYRSVHAPYGDWTDLGAMRDRFDFMFDCVANHASARGEWFRAFREGDPRYRDHFIAFEGPVDTGGVFRPRTTPLLTPVVTAEGTRHVWTTFGPDQVDLNYANPEVFLEMVGVILFYVTQGARAIRLDAIAYAWKKMGTSCFDLPETHDLVRLFRAVLDRAAPGVWLVTETVLPHQANIAYFGNGDDEAHLAYNFVLETLLLHVFLTADAGRLREWCNRIGYGGPRNALLNLSVSHDGIHTVPAKGALTPGEIDAIAADCERKGGRVLFRSVPGGQEPYEFNITYPSAVRPTAAFLASQAVQLSLKGVPLVYFNNLIGARNWTEGVERLGYGRAINREKFDAADLARRLRGDGPQGRVYRAFRRMLEVRKTEPLLSPVAGQEVLETDRRVLAVRRSREGRSLLAVVNVSGEPVRLDGGWIASSLGRQAATDRIGGRTLDLASAVELAPYAYWWLT